MDFSRLDDLENRVLGLESQLLVTRDEFLQNFQQLMQSKLNVTEKLLNTLPEISPVFPSAAPVEESYSSVHDLHDECKKRTPSFSVSSMLSDISESRRAPLKSKPVPQEYSEATSGGVATSGSKATSSSLNSLWVPSQPKGVCRPRCTVCNTYFPNNIVLGRHLLEVHNEKRHPCPHCQSPIKALKDLRKHIKRLHGDGERHDCQKCGREFETAYKAAKHSCRQKEPGDTEPVPEAQMSKLKNKNSLNGIDNVGNKKCFSCMKCDSSFACKYKLRRHIEAVHVGLRPHVCTFCGKRFTRSSALDKHVQNLHLSLRESKAGKKRGPYKTQKRTRERTMVCCEICGKGYMCIKAHRAKAHGIDVKHKCQMCGAGFHYESMLTQHTNIVHLKLKKVVCQLCGKAFNRLKGLKEHTLFRHTEARPFSCDQCPLRFKDDKHLKRHISTVHDKLKPYMCLLCGSVFCQSGNLYAHMRSVHKDLEGEWERIMAKRCENGVLAPLGPRVHSGGRPPKRSAQDESTVESVASLHDVVQGLETKSAPESMSVFPSVH